MAHYAPKCGVQIFPVDENNIQTISYRVPKNHHKAGHDHYLALTANCNKGRIDNQFANELSGAPGTSVSRYAV
ncbi:hypothetical protein TNCV_4675521 [Trichonephila clavipes]|nr:hypothetical protein TNCV_4675521 [Trichonephila clavipes]